MDKAVGYGAEGPSFDPCLGQFFFSDLDNMYILFESISYFYFKKNQKTCIAGLSVFLKLPIYNEKEGKKSCPDQTSNT